MGEARTRFTSLVRAIGTKDLDFVLITNWGKPAGAIVPPPNPLPTETYARRLDRFLAIYGSKKNGKTPKSNWAQVADIRANLAATIEAVVDGDFSAYFVCRRCSWEIRKQFPGPFDWLAVIVPPDQVRSEILSKRSRAALDALLPAK